MICIRRVVKRPKIPKAASAPPKRQRATARKDVPGTGTKATRALQ
jgi:hypothetical protein